MVLGMVLLVVVLFIKLFFFFTVECDRKRGRLAGLSDEGVRK